MAPREDSEFVAEPLTSGSPRYGAGRSDEELAREAQRVAPDSTEAFEELVRRLERPLFGFLMVRVGHVAEVEELVQEAFLRAWCKLDRYDSRWRFATWLFTLAKRLAVSRARARRPDSWNSGQSGAWREASLVADEEGSDPVQRAADSEELAGVWRLAARILPVEQRSALWLRYAEGLSNQEIAGILGRPSVTVRVLLFRAREALARGLREPTSSRKAAVALQSLAVPTAHGDPR